MAAPAPSPWIVRCVETVTRDGLSSFDDEWNLGVERETKTCEQIDHHIASLQMFNDFPDALRPKEFELKRLRNSKAPIHQLPSEIFTEILLMTLGHGISWTSRALHTLAQVSSAWFQAVTSSSLFWQHISASDPDNIRMLVPVKNPSGPLKVVCSLYSDQNDATLRTALPHISRWRGASFATPFPDSFPDCLEAPTPNLTSLRVFSATSQRKIRLGKGPHLHILDLSAAALAWDHDRLAHLRVIGLHQLVYIPSIPQLHAILSSSPELVSLAISDMHVLHSMRKLLSSSHAHHPIINLPELRQLSLTSIPSQYTDFLLSTIDAPGLMRVAVEDVSASLPRNVLSVVVPIIASRAPEVSLGYIPDQGKLIMTTQSYAFREPRALYYEEGQSRRSSMGVSFRKNQDWAALASWLSSVALPPTKLAFETPDEEPTVPFPNELFMALPSLTSIDVGWLDYPGPIFQYLAEHDVCPALARVKAKRWDIQRYQDSLVALVNRRRGSGQLTEVAVPAALGEILRLENGKDLLYPDIRL